MRSYIWIMSTAIVGLVLITIGILLISFGGYRKIRANRNMIRRQTADRNTFPLEVIKNDNDVVMRDKSKTKRWNKVDKSISEMDVIKWEMRVHYKPRSKRNINTAKTLKISNIYENKYGRSFHKLNENDIYYQLKSFKRIEKQHSKNIKNRNVVK